VIAPTLGMKITNLRRRRGREWLWRNCGGWAPGGIDPFYHCAVEPGTGAPGRLQEAAGEWGVAPTLHPGEERACRLTVGLWNAED
jgi:hypothetical protein